MAIGSGTDTARETLARHEARIARLMEAETARARDVLSGGPTAKHAEDRPGDRFDEGCEAANPIENAASPGRRRPRAETDPRRAPRSP